MVISEQQEQQQLQAQDETSERTILELIQTLHPTP